MDLTIWAAITGSVITAFVSYSIYILNKRDEALKELQTIQKIDNEAIAADELLIKLVGTWKCHLLQYQGAHSNFELDHPFIYDASLIIEYDEKGAGGYLVMALPDEKNKLKVSLKFAKVVRKGLYLRFDYHNINTDIMHFGTFILEYAPTLDSFFGTFAGYGAFSKNVVSGKITGVKE